MLPGRGVNDDGLVASGGLHFSHAVTESLEPAPCLGCAQIDKQQVAFGVGNRSPPVHLTFALLYLAGNVATNSIDRWIHASN
jgi:hypothetical protein